MDLMIDLETLGKTTKAPIISIGACFFDEKGIYETKHLLLDVAEQIDSGKRKTDWSTIKWWMSQSEEARNIFKQEAILPNVALAKFKAFCELHKDISVWGNGATFDISILESIFADYGGTVPWKYNKIMDLRTFKRFIYDGKDLPFNGVRHDALADAIYQAEVVIKGMQGARNLKA